MIEVDCQVRIKVCGLTQAENACSCADAGADWIGLNFHPASPRSITPQRGAEIAGALHDLGKGEPVALFVNRPIDEVLATLRQVGPIRMIQLHGDEPPEFLAACKAVDPAIRVIRAFRLSDQESVEWMIAYLERAECLNCSPYAVLVDAHVPDWRVGLVSRSLRRSSSDFPAIRA